MVNLSVPAAYVAGFDATWRGIRHANRCARMVRGRLVVRLPSSDTVWMVYGSDETQTLAHVVGTSLVIEGDRLFSGRMCYGIAN